MNTKQIEHNEKISDSMDNIDLYRNEVNIIINRFSTFHSIHILLRFICSETQNNVVNLVEGEEFIVRLVRPKHKSNNGYISPSISAVPASPSIVTASSGVLPDRHAASTTILGLGQYSRSFVST